MRVLIDADGCPVTYIAIRICKQASHRCILLCDTAHTFNRDGAETVVLDKGADSVDYAIVNMATPGDLVITQDYGLAAMCLSRGIRVMHQDGWEYTTDNIDALLTFRHEARKHRAATGRFRGPKKRSSAQNTAFEEALKRILMP